MQLDDTLAARLTNLYGMRVPAADGLRMQATPKSVGVQAGANITPQVLERLLWADGVPCAWSFEADAEMTIFRVYYVGGREGDHGHA